MYNLPVYIIQPCCAVYMVALLGIVMKTYERTSRDCVNYFLK